MKIRQLLLFAIILGLASTLFAQAELKDLPAADPSTVGMSEEHLARIDGFIQSYVDRKWLPGGVFMIMRKGKVVYNKSFGDKRPGTPYQSNDIFRLASMTKAITTVSIMQLWEQGKLGLDDPIHYYIPGFKDAQVLDKLNKEDSSFTTVPALRPITIRQLLTHSSGIVYGSFDPETLGIVYGKYGMNAVGLSHPEWSTEEFINKLAEVPLAFQPGSQYTYGLNMDVLGRIIEVVSGMSLKDYFVQNIFEPLGMEDTHFYLPKAKYARLVPVYTETPEEGMVLAEKVGAEGPSLYPMLPEDHNHYAGGGGLSGTAMDYAKFIQVLVEGGTYRGHRLLGRKAMEVMTSDQLILLNREGKGFSKLPGLTYGLGFALYTQEGGGLSAKSPGTFEWGGYFNTKYFIDPAEELTFVGMTQILPFQHQEFWNRLNTMIYSAVE